MSLTSKAKSFEPSRESDAHAERMAITDWVFARLLAFYGTKFTESFATVPVNVFREIWCEELASYTLAELNAGLAWCRSSKWPPTLPEFLCACRPSNSDECAFQEAAEKMGQRERGLSPPWSSPAVYWAAVECGSFDMRRLGFKAMESRWSRELAAQRAKGGWPAIPTPPVGLLPLPPPSLPPAGLAARVAAALGKQLTKPPGERSALQLPPIQRELAADDFVDAVMRAESGAVH
jgi:hypothetical protein